MGPVFADVEADRPRQASSTIDDRVATTLAIRPRSARAAVPQPGSRQAPAPDRSNRSGPTRRRNCKPTTTTIWADPLIDRIAVNTYPTVRAAWAEMLRDHLDMLYEVGPDALDSLERSNQDPGVHLRSAAISTRSSSIPASRRCDRRRFARRCRQAIDRDALRARGAERTRRSPRRARSGRITGRLRPNLEQVRVRSRGGSEGAGGTPACISRAWCPPDYERIALVVKRQLAGGRRVDGRQGSARRIRSSTRWPGATSTRCCSTSISGPSLFRPFLLWHSGAANLSGFCEPRRRRCARPHPPRASDDDYRAGVAAFQHAIIEDPPAIFLAWSERARAVSKRFVVPDAEPGRDILSTLRLWKPAADDRPVEPN